LDPAAINDSGLAGSNNYGLRTYEISLSDFTCESGTLAEMQSDARQVTVKVVGGTDAAADASTAGDYTMLQVGMVAFSK
jgi:hypothetical protein